MAFYENLLHQEQIFFQIDKNSRIKFIKPLQKCPKSAQTKNRIRRQLLAVSGSGKNSIFSPFIRPMLSGRNRRRKGLFQDSLAEATDFFESCYPDFLIWNGTCFSARSWRRVLFFDVCLAIKAPFQVPKRCRACAGYRWQGDAWNFRAIFGNARSSCLFQEWFLKKRPQFLERG